MMHMLSGADYFVESNITAENAGDIIDLLIGYWCKTCFEISEDQPIMPKEVSSIIQQYTDRQIGVLSNSQMGCNINWKINATDKFLNYTIGKSIESDKFECCKLQWHLKIYPNGGNRKSLGLSNLYLYLDRFPSNIKLMTIHYSLRCKETDSCFKPIATLKENDLCGGWSNRCQLLSEFKDLHDLSLLDEINFECAINILRITNNQGAIIYNYPITVDHTASYSFSWTIDRKLMQLFKNSYHGKRFASLTSDNKMWCLRCYPNGRSKEQKGNVRLYLQLCSLPMNISKIKARFQLICLSTNTHFEDKQFFSYENNSTKNGLPTNKLLMEQFLEISECVFTAIIHIIEMYDMDGELIYTNDTQDQDWMQYILGQSSYTTKNLQINTKKVKHDKTDSCTPQNANANSTLSPASNMSFENVAKFDLPMRSISEKQALGVVTNNTNLIGDGDDLKLKDDLFETVLHERVRNSTTTMNTVAAPLPLQNEISDSRISHYDSDLNFDAAKLIQNTSSNSFIDEQIQVDFGALIDPAELIANTNANKNTIANVVLDANENENENEEKNNGDNMLLGRIKGNDDVTSNSVYFADKFKYPAPVVTVVPSKIALKQSVTHDETDADLVNKKSNSDLSDLNDEKDKDTNVNANENQYRDDEKADVQVAETQTQTQHMEKYVQELASGLKELANAVQGIHAIVRDNLQVQQKQQQLIINALQQERFQSPAPVPVVEQPVLKRKHKVTNKSHTIISTSMVRSSSEDINIMPLRANEMKKQSSIENDNDAHANSPGGVHARNSDISTLQSWLENNVGLPQYFEIFVENGIENLEVVRNLTDNHLKEELRIDKIGHRILLQKEIVKLKTPN